MFNRLYKISMSITLSVATILVSFSSGMKKVNAEEYKYNIRNPRVAFNTVDTIYFGNYWQEDTNGDGKANKSDEKTPIKWRILEKYDDGTALVLSDKILDMRSYYNGTDKENGDGTVYKDYSCTWENSDMRAWLNGNSDGDFYKEAFSDSESESIVPERIELGKNYTTNSNQFVDDKVFLLSSADLTNSKYGFNTDSKNYDESRLAKVTPFSNNGATDIDGVWNWFLRTTGVSNDYDAEVIRYGYISNSKIDSHSGKSGVRPAMRIKLDSQYIQDGGKTNVSVKGSEWDTISFGTYNGSNIIWRVLQVEGDDAFILANNVLFECKYSDEYSSTWENSYIRSYLNESFYSTAFSDNEKKMIKLMNVKNINNGWASGGNDTRDRIYLLSLKDMINQSYGFSDTLYGYSETRSAINSKWNKCCWWLRSPGADNQNASDVLWEGDVYDIGDSIAEEDIWVRPAMHIDLSVEYWKRYSTVSVGDSKGGSEVPLNQNDRMDSVYVPVEESKNNSTEISQKTSTTTSSTSEVTSTNAQSYKDVGENVGKISADGKILIDTNGHKWFISSRLNKKNLKKNLLVADKKSGGKYKITQVIKKNGSIVGGNVTYMAPYNKNCTKATAGATVKIAGISFKITRINTNAFRYCKKLTSFTVGGNVSEIGANAFYGCSKLKTITIKSTKIKKVGTKAFEGINSKAKFKIPASVYKNKKSLKRYKKFISKAGAPKKCVISK